jgi:uncharacterized membrane-anchored protein
MARSTPTFAIHADGFSRMVLLAGGMTPRRLGRLVQQLLEIDTYRMAALLGLPAAREASPCWPAPSANWPSWPMPSAAPTATPSRSCWTA